MDFLLPSHHPSDIINPARFGPLGLRNFTIKRPPPEHTVCAVAKGSLSTPSQLHPRPQTGCCRPALRTSRGEQSLEPPPLVNAHRAANLPTAYGMGGPRILGLDSLRADDQLEWSVAGLFNTGTHLLAELFRTNCDVKSNSSFSVAWGKHHPLHWRGEPPAPSQWANDLASADASDMRAARQVPIVVIKDPLTWFKSHCAAPYFTSFAFNLRTQCFVANNSVQVNWVVNNCSYEYASLAHMWSEWYRNGQVEGPHIRHSPFGCTQTVAYPLSQQTGISSTSTRPCRA